MAEVEYTRKPDGTMERKTPIAKGDTSEHWAYIEDEDTCHGALWATVKSIKRRQSWRRQADDLALQLFSEMRYVGYRASSTGYVVQDIIQSRLGKNVIRSIVRSLTSALGRRRVRPYVTTNGARWDQRQLAENLEKWLLGKLREQKADTIKFPLFRLHAMVFGTGCIRVYVNANLDVVIDVVPTPEILMDPAESRYGDVEPPNIYFLRTCSIRKLYHDYPDKTDILDELGSSGNNDEWTGGFGSWDKEASSSQTPYLEAIHLPSAPGAGDGKRIISVPSGILHEEEWKEDDYSCAWLRREVRPMGFWGIGVPEAQAPKQIEIARTAEARQEILEMLSNPYWLEERGHKIEDSAVSTEIGRRVQYTQTGGPPPQLISNNAVPAELWKNDEVMAQSAFEDEGISQLSAQMMKPAGLNSGKALRVFSEFETELLSDLAANNDDALTRVCELLVKRQIDAAKAAKKAKKGKKFTVTYLGDGEIERIDWNDEIAKDIDNMVVEILPASMLSNTLSARIEDVYDMRDLGLLTDAEETWDHLGMPDRKRYNKKHLSHRKLLEKIIEFQIVKKGQDIQPEPTWNLKLAYELTINMISELELYEDAPKDRLELLQRFSVKILNMQAMAKPPAPQGMNPNGTTLAAGAGAIDPATGLPLPPDSLGFIPPEAGGLSGPDLAAGGLPIDPGALPGLAPAPGSGGPLGPLGG